jgi:hypothetical protein
MKQMNCGPDMLSRPYYAPLTGLIHQVYDERYKRQDDEYSSEQKQCREHLLHEIDLQRKEGCKRYPHPLSSFLLAELLAELLFELLAEFHLNDSPRTLPNYLDAIHRPKESTSIKDATPLVFHGTWEVCLVALLTENY